MPEENVDPVVEPEVKQELSVQAEETAPAPDAPVEVEAEAQEGGLAKDLENPVFKQRLGQVWARAKGAEAELASVKEQAQREREERIRLEERLKAQEEVKKATQPEYSWEQLEGFIAEGKISVTQAVKYREDLQKEKTKRETLEALKSEIQVTSHDSTISGELNRYTQAMPEILQNGTPERQKVVREYNYLVKTLKYPETKATELAATRAALGDVETVERTVQAKRSAPKESFMETHSSTQKPQPKGNDPIAQLTEREKKHYEKMIDRGRYSGWDEVRKELAWTPPSLRVTRG